MSHPATTSRFSHKIAAGRGKQTLPPLPTEFLTEPLPLAIQTTEHPGGPLPITVFEPPMTNQPSSHTRVPTLYVALLLLFAAIGFATWYVLTAESVRLEIEPPPDRIAIRGAPARLELDGRYLLRPGTYTLIAEKMGYYPGELAIEVTRRENQTFFLRLEKLPGRLSVVTTPVENAAVAIDGGEVGRTPLSGLEVKPGRRDITIRADNYLERRVTVTIEGAAAHQTLEIELTPDWAPIALRSTPAGAQVLVDGKERGVTPLIAALKQGERDIELRLAGYNPWRRRLRVIAEEPQTLPMAALEIADGRISIRTTPIKVSVTLNGAYQGQTPIEVSVRPGNRHRIGLSRAGYRPVQREITVASGEQAQLDVELEPEIGVIKLVTSPEGAIVYVNGARRGSANQRLRLPAVPQRLEIRKPGFAPHRTTVTPHPGFEQELRVRLQPTG